MAKGKIANMLLDEISKLDMSDAARMQRAKDMGFDTDNVYYHGTSEEFDEFDPSKGGRVYGIDDDKGLVFFTSNKDEAQDAAAQASRVIGDSPRVLDNYLRLENPLMIDSKGKNPTVYLDGKKDQIKYELEFGENSDGIPYDGVIVINKQTGERTAATANPNLIRSTKAAFNPAKKDSSNLMASVAPTAVGVGYSALTPDQAQAAVQQLISPTSSSTSGLLDRAKKQYDSGVTGSARGPINSAGQYADYADKYNQWRKTLGPIDMLAPVGELPQSLLDKIAYGERVTMSDKIKAMFGLL